MQRSTLILTATLTTALIYSKWAQTKPKPPADERDYTTALTQYRGQVEADISRLTTLLTQHTRQEQQLHEELDETFDEHERRRMEQFRAARRARHSSFDQLMTQCEGTLTASEAQWDEMFTADTQKWTRAMKTVSKFAKQAFSKERKTWKTWSTRFREAQQRANRELHMLRGKYLDAHLGRVRDLQEAHYRMGHDAPDNQFPRHIVVDDVTMYWYTGYTIGGKAMQVIVDDEDEDEDEDAASEDEAVQAEPEDTFTEHGGAEDTEARGKEAEQVEGGEGEQTTALTNDQSEPPQTSEESSQSSEFNEEAQEDKDKEISQERIFTATLEELDKRWTDVTNLIKATTDQSTLRFSSLLTSHKTKSDFNSGLRSRLHDADTNSRHRRFKSLHTKTSQKRRHYRGPFDAFLTAEAESWSEQLQDQEFKFQRIFEYPVERMLKYWKEAFTAVRTKQNMHSHHYLNLYQKILHGESIGHPTYDWEKAVRLSETPVEDKVGEQASHSSSSVDNRSLEPSENSFPDPDTGAAPSQLNDVNVTQRNPDVPSSSAIPEQATPEFVEQREEPEEMPVHSNDIDASTQAQAQAPPSKPMQSTIDASTQAQAQAPPPMPTQSAVPKAEFKATAASSFSSSFVTATLSKLANIFKRAPTHDAVKCKCANEAEAELKVPDLQTQRLRIIEERARLHAESMVQYQETLSRAFEKTQHDTRSHARKSEVERDAAFQRIEDQWKEDFTLQTQAHERAYAYEISLQHRLFKKGQARRTKCVETRLDDMTRQVKKSCDSRVEMYSDMFDGIWTLVDEQLEMFKAEEEERLVRVGGIIGPTLLLLQPLAAT